MLTGRNSAKEKTPQKNSAVSFLVGKGDDKCTEFVNRVLSGDVHYGNAVTEILGNICVHSESGWIPDFVVKKLGDLCKYACNHMG